MVAGLGPALVVALLVAASLVALASVGRTRNAAAFERAAGLLLVSGLVLLGVLLSGALRP